jgi:hypothetical protein
MTEKLTLDRSRGQITGGGTTYIGIPGAVFTAVTTEQIAASVLRIQPFFVASPVMVDRYIVEVTATTGGTVGTIGIYNMDKNLVATSVVHDQGGYAISVAVLNMDVTPFLLMPGRYGLAMSENGTNTTFRRLAGGGSEVGGGQVVAAMGAASILCRCRKQDGFGPGDSIPANALPNPCGAVTLNVGGAGTFYYGLLRLSAA